MTRNIEDLIRNNDALAKAIESIIKIRPACDDPRIQDQDTHEAASCRWCKARAAIEDWKQFKGEPL